VGLARLLSLVHRTFLSSFHHPASKARFIGIAAGETYFIGFAFSSGFGLGVHEKASLRAKHACA